MSTEDVVLRVIQYVALVLALCVHEFAHAATARLLGDGTAEDEGRLTLSPIAHADPIGTVLFPLMGFFVFPLMGWGGVPLFGWAKPVPVQPNNFKRGWYAKGRIWTAAAGPISNVIQALAWTLVIFVAVRFVFEGRVVEFSPGWWFFQFAMFSVVINLILAAFNFIPIPPLDGGHVASWGLPREQAEKYDAFVAPPMGLALLVGLLLVAPWLFRPVIATGQLLVGLAIGA